MKLIHRLFIVEVLLCFAWFLQPQYANSAKVILLARSGIGTYSYAGSGQFSGSGNIATYTINIGTATSTRYIVVGLQANGTAAYTMTAAGTSLNSDVLLAPGGNNTSQIFSGLVTSGSGSQSIVATCDSCTFQARTVFVWVITSLNTNAVKHTASSQSGSSMSINVTAGDFLFTTRNQNPVTFNGSTEAPFENLTGSGSTISGADWTIISTNAAFSVTASSVYTAPNPGTSASYN